MVVLTEEVAIGMNLLNAVVAVGVVGVVEGEVVGEAVAAMTGIVEAIGVATEVEVAAETVAVDQWIQTNLVGQCVVEASVIASMAEDSGALVVRGALVVLDRWVLLMEGRRHHLLLTVSRRPLSPFL